MIPLIDAALLVFMAVITIVIIRHHGLFTVVMLSGIFSLLSAGLFTVMDLNALTTRRYSHACLLSDTCPWIQDKERCQRQDWNPIHSLAPG